MANRLCIPVKDHEMRKFTDESKVRVSSGLCLAGTQGTLSLTADTASAVRVGVSNLAGRQMAVVHNDSGSTIYWGYSTVTTTTGIPIANGDQAVWQLDPVYNIDIYIVSGSNVTVRVVEG